MNYLLALRHHALFFIILAIATVIRVQALSTKMIFISDQGRDFIVAQKMVENGTVPLLGIPSSIPRFKQGPLFIYFLAAIYWLTNGSLLASGVLAAGFSLAAVVALYLLVYTFDSRRAATWAAAIFSLMPMLLVHARMPYHIVPIPLFVIIFVWQLMRLSSDAKWSAFGAGLAFALVFQFELAAFPLLLLIPVAIRERTRSGIHQSFKHWLKIISGILIGLLPQVIFDLTHRFAQLGGFIIWIGYKMVTALLPFTHNSLSDSATPTKLVDLLRLFLSIFTQTGFVADQAFWGILILCTFIASIVAWSNATVFHRLVTVSCVLMTVGVIVHRVPSEAYMPLMAPGFVLLIVLNILKIPSRYLLPISLVMVCSLGLSLRTLESQSFFLLQPGESDWSVKRFGPSIQSQRNIVKSLYSVSGSRCVILESLERDETFPTLYNHLEYVLSLDPRSKGLNCAHIRIDRPLEAKRRWIDQGNVIDLGAYWIRLLDDQKVYAKAY